MPEITFIYPDGAALEVQNIGQSYAVNDEIDIEDQIYIISKIRHSLAEEVSEDEFLTLRHIGTEIYLTTRA